METATPRSCPKCSTNIPSEGAWCPTCGLQVADTCWQCGTLLANEWAYCARCGLSTAEPGVIPCPSCREPVAPRSAFCPRCGAAARPRCAGCGRTLRREWIFCPDCGRGAASSDEGMPLREPAVAIEAPSLSQEPRFAAEPPRRPVSEEAEALNKRGASLYDANDLETAIQCFRQALAIDPENADYHTNLAVALDEDEQDEEALAEYQQALALNPRQATALLNVGYLYSEQERYEEARQVWERAIRADPTSAEADEARQNLQRLDEL